MPSFVRPISVPTEKITCEQDYLCEFGGTVSGEESVSNDDGDGNKNGKKAENGFRLA